MAAYPPPLGTRVLLWVITAIVKLTLTLLSSAPSLVKCVG